MQRMAIIRSQHRADRHYTVAGIAYPKVRSIRAWGIPDCSARNLRAPVLWDVGLIGAHRSSSIR